MNQAFFTGQNFYKGTEGHKARNLADIRFADFYVLRQIFNPCLGLSAAFSVYGSDVYETRIVNVDFGTRFFRNLFNHLAARPDDIANLVGMYLHGNNTRCIGGQFLTRCIEDRQHLIHNMKASFMSLFQSRIKNFTAEAFDFNIHLNSRNALCRTGYLEVHITQSIFHALNIRQNRKVVILRYKSHSYARNGSLNGNARIHKCQRTAANATHRAGTVGFENFRHDANSVREFFFRRHHLSKSPFGQLTVTYFTTTRTAGRTSFTDAEGREVVMVHVTAFRFRTDTVDMLSFRQGCQGSKTQNLRLSARKQTRAVSTLEESYFT